MAFAESPSQNHPVAGDLGDAGTQPPATCSYALTGESPGGFLKVAGWPVAEHGCAGLPGLSGG